MLARVPKDPGGVCHSTGSHVLAKGNAAHAIRSGYWFFTSPAWRQHQQ